MIAKDWGKCAMILLGGNVNHELACLPCGLLLQDTGCPKCGRRPCDPLVEATNLLPFSPKKLSSDMPTAIFEAALDFSRTPKIKNDLETCVKFVNYLISKGIIPKDRDLKTHVNDLEWAIVTADKPMVRIRGWIVQFCDIKERPVKFRLLSTKTNPKLLASTRSVA